MKRVRACIICNLEFCLQNSRRTLAQNKTGENKLELTVGEHVEVLAQKGEWFKGRVNTKVGIFPKSCVKLLSPQSAQKKRHRLRALQEWCEYVLSLHSFEGEDQDLSFKRGTVIKVLSSTGDWWRGQLEDGSVGFFPRNYVKPLKRKTSSNSSKHAATPFPVPSHPITLPPCSTTVFILTTLIELYHSPSVL